MSYYKLTDIRIQKRGEEEYILFVKGYESNVRPKKAEWTIARHGTYEDIKDQISLLSREQEMGNIHTTLTGRKVRQELETAEQIYGMCANNCT